MQMSIKLVINSLSVSPHSVKLALKKPFDKTLYLYIANTFVLLKPTVPIKLCN